MNEKNLSKSDSGQSYCTFHCGDVVCGIPVEKVREIVSNLALTPVPRSSDFIAGLVNLRGQILTVVDMMHWLHRDRQTRLPASRFYLIAEVGSEAISLQVDEMGPVISTDDYVLEPVPKHMERIVADRIQSVARLSDQLVLILKIEKLREIRSLTSAAYFSVGNRNIDNDNVQDVGHREHQDIQ